MDAPGFRLSLKKISDHLSRQDIDDLKYLCEDMIPLARLEPLKTGTAIFSDLMHTGKLTSTDLSKVEFLLEGIGKVHLLKLCTDAGYGGPKATYTPPFQSENVPKAAPTGNLVGGTSEFEYRKALTVIAGELTPHNFGELLYMSAEYFGGVQPRLHKPLELFTAMEQQHVLMPGNLSALQSLLGSIGRKDLANKLVNVAAMQPTRYKSNSSPHPAPNQLYQFPPPTQPSHTPPSYSVPPYPAPPPANPYHSIGMPVNVLTTGPTQNVSGFQDLPFGQPASGVPSPSLSSSSSGSTTRPDAPYQQGYQPPPNQDQRFPGSGQSPESSVEPKATTYPVSEIGAGGPDDMVVGHSGGGGTYSNLPDRRTDFVSAVERNSAGNQDLIKEYQRKEVDEEFLREQQAKLQEEQQKQTMSQDLQQQQAKEKDLRRQIHQLQQDREQLARQLKAEASRLKPSGPSVGKDLRYPMRSSPHGMCLIVNNDQFYSTSDEPKLPSRRGSDVDQSNLSIIFQQLHYQMVLLNNATGTQIMQKMKEISSCDHSRYDSFVCCLLTHGKMDGVFGADGQLVAVSDLANMLKGASCPTLNGKPKMFFIQACRGDDEDKGATLETDAGPDSNRLGRSLPNAADFLFAYSTAPGTVSWRSVTYGSWYISKLCEVLDHHAKAGMDVLSMLTIVNDKVSQAYTKQGFKQCPAPVNMLRKQVIFT